ncbi:MAG: GDP-mannose 4,6-dehydratase [Candidatus Promineifilaceae bacterium]|nr:GDP-mannose 4,6-dehydratase [Candidatus Promineifilaceae bacterium]
MKLFITGGAGFIGANCADRFLEQGHQVVLYDNLSRPGAGSNVAWLRQRHGPAALSVVAEDVRDYAQLAAAIPGSDAVIHLASQVAVTTSVRDPRTDFEINALGTFNVLEAVRHQAPEAAVLYASTNKVYGDLDSVQVEETPTRFQFSNFTHGIPETFPLDFHSPYGCSKGAGDQYVIDYARIYGLRSVSLRQSCIYGPRQFGVEDQGWVAHFIIAACLGRPITIFGDGQGKQVRDLLHVDDLIRAYSRVIERADDVAGLALNLGGGPNNALSIWAEFGPLLEERLGHPVPVSHADWRPGDQRVFVADIRRAAARLDWQPQIDPRTGIAQLVAWVQDHLDLLRHTVAAPTARP